MFKYAKKVFYIVFTYSKNNSRSHTLTRMTGRGILRPFHVPEKDPNGNYFFELFDNMRIFDGKEEADKKYTVTIQVNDVSSKNVLPPYNPFIFVESDKTRGREVHLVKYPPTDKANPSLLGTGKDVSRPDEGLYYVSIDLMPFALNMPISEFPIPEEGVRIDESYPKFATWVKSNGAQAKDWYKYPKK